MTSSIEWLAKELESHGDPTQLVISWQDLDSLVKQAVTAHREEIITAHRSAYGRPGKTTNMIALGKIFDKQAEQYYDETFSTK